MTQRAIFLVVLVVINMASAIAVVEAKQRTRELFHRLQVERVHRDHLNTEWAQLQLEDSAWGSPDRVAQVARNQLGMIQPKKYVVLGDNR